MQTGLRRTSYQYYDYPAGPLIDLNNTRHPLVLQLDPNVVVSELEPEPEHRPEQHHQYQPGEQPLFQQSQFHQLPLQVDNHLNDVSHQQQVTVVATSEQSQNFDCFLDTSTTTPAATTCYSTGLLQPQGAVELNSTPAHLLNPNPLYNPDNVSLQPCQLLSSHAAGIQVDNNAIDERPHSEHLKQESLPPTNLYHQHHIHNIHQNETTNQPAISYEQQHTHATLYYHPSQLDGSNCGQLEQPPILAPSTYHLNQLVAGAPLQQVSSDEPPACEYFHFQPQQTTVASEQQHLHLLQTHPQDSDDKFNEQNYQPTSGKFASFAGAPAQPLNELSPQLQELFQPTATANSFDTTRFLAASSSHPLEQQQQQQQHHFQDQTRVEDIQQYHELIRQPHVISSFSYLDSGATLERRQTFEPSLASQEETQSSSSSAASISSSEESASSILTRDEKKAREANIPIAYNDIINLSIEQFNEQLSKYNLTESQLNLIKDIRRRGKNKVAAQSCRKRKMEQISELQHEVGHLSSRRKLLSAECEQLVETHDRIVHQYEKVYSIIQEHLAAAQ